MARPGCKDPRSGSLPFAEPHPASTPFAELGHQNKRWEHSSVELLISQGALSGPVLFPALGADRGSWLCLGWLFCWA
jgi:hypothetical protein